MRICGQEFTLDILDRIREAVVVEPQISRRTLSRRVCQWLDWRSPSGRWQEGGCRKALAELDRRHVLELPTPCTAFAPRQQPALEVAETEVCAPLEELGAVELIPISAHRSHEAQVFTRATGACAACCGI